MTTDYFEGIAWGAHNHLPRCSAWIDRSFEYFALNFAFSGRILWAVDDGELQFLPAPLAWWTYPGPRYVYGAAAGESWDHYFVTLSGPRAERWLQSDLMPRKSPFCVVQDAESFRAAWDELFACLQGGGEQNAHAVHLVEGLLLRLQTPRVLREETGAVTLAVEELMAQIRRDPAAAWDVQNEARRLGFSYAHLRRAFAQRAGLAPRQFILQTRLDIAAAQLRAADAPIKTIAAHSGIGDLPHFSKLFRARYGLSPGAYRREAQLL